jgi:hypothetical protein
MIMITTITIMATFTAHTAIMALKSQPAMR